MVHAALQHCPLMTGCEEVARRSAQLEGSVKRTHALCVALVKEFEDTYPAFPCQKGSFILKQVELEEELATQKMLIPIWEVWKHLFARQIPDPNQGLFNQCLFYKRVIEEIYGPI
jgi:hypothetical protein